MATIKVAIVFFWDMVYT